MMKTGILVTGDKATMDRLRTLPDRVRVRVLKPAIRKAGYVIAQAISPLASRLSGTLSRSIGVNVKEWKRKATIIARVGPRWKYTGTRDGKTIKPSLYAHLVEKGHRTIPRGAGKKSGGGWKARLADKRLHELSILHSLRGKATRRSHGKLLAALDVRLTAMSTSFVKPKPFMAPGFAASNAQAQSVLAVEISAGITQEAARNG